VDGESAQVEGPSETAKPEPAKPEPAKPESKPSHKLGRAPRRPNPSLPKGAARSEPNAVIRRSVAGGRTAEDAKAGKPDPELSALRDAERVLFPRPLSGVVSGFDWNLPKAAGSSPDVVASGLPPDGRLEPSREQSDAATTAEWIRSLALPNLPVRLEARVVRYLKFYRDNPRGKTIARIWAKKSGRFAPALRAELAKAGLPTDLVWLSLIESGHNPTIHSPAGAAGLWQFMPDSGRLYGLTVDRWVDERLDPRRATEAAILYLSDLYRRFGNWELAMAGYNMGHGGMSRAIKKFNTNDFWELCRHEAGIPWETSLYVPKIFAIAIVMKNKRAFGIADVKPDAPERFDTVLVRSGTGLDAIAKAARLSEKRLAELNPQLLANRVPPAPPQTREKTWSVRVPSGRGVSATAALAKTTLPDHDVRRFRQGDTVESIAKERGVSEAVLSDLNGLARSETIETGTVLLVPKSKRSGAEAAPDAVVVPSRTFDYPGHERVFYEVQPGDKLVKIAAALGVTRADLESWNAIDPSARLQPGLILQAWVRDSHDLSRVRVIPADNTRVLVAGTPEFIDYFEGQNGKQRVVVLARDGETLAQIGKRYGLSSGWMERINRMSRRSKLRAGQKVVVYVKKGAVSGVPDDSKAAPLPPVEAPAPSALPAVRPASVGDSVAGR
jgi:membrane-bound lytic murein transglycosylase D